MLSISPWISNKKKETVLSMLYKGFTPQQVFDQHIKLIHGQFHANPHSIPTRDNYLSMKNIFNISQRVAEETYQLYDNDAESTKHWVIENPSWVLYIKYR